MKPNLFEIHFGNGAERLIKAVLYEERHTSSFIRDYLASCLRAEGQWPSHEAEISAIVCHGQIDVFGDNTAEPYLRETTHSPNSAEPQNFGKSEIERGTIESEERNYFVKSPNRGERPWKRSLTGSELSVCVSQFTGHTDQQDTFCDQFAI